MIRINLLPYREEQRKARRQQFYTMAGGVAVLAALLVVLVYSAIGEYVSAQDSKNQFLKKEISGLDKQIAQIRELKNQTQALLARKNIIESLQQDRSDSVRLLSELVKLTPDGVYLKSMKQDGQQVSLDGYTQSNAKVSVFMRNLEASPWLEKPNLIEIKAVDVNKKRLNEFSLTVTVTRTIGGAGKDSGDRPVPPAPPKGAQP